MPFAEEIPNGLDRGQSEKADRLWVRLLVQEEETDELARFRRLLLSKDNSGLLADHALNWQGGPRQNLHFLPFFRLRASGKLESPEVWAELEALHFSAIKPS